MNTFRFTLRDNDGAVTFGSDMVLNWDAVKIALSRNRTYRGLFRKFSGEMEFDGVIRQRLIRLVDKYGSEAEIYLSIELGDGNKWRSSFKKLGSESKADMTSWQPGELTCRLSFDASGFEEVLFNRHDIDTEYSKTESIDGVPIPAFANEFRKALLHCRVLQLNSELNFDSSTFTPVDLRKSSPISLPPFGNTGFNQYMSVPFAVNYASDSDFKTTNAIFSDDINSPDSFFLLKASEAKSINVQYSVNTSIRCQNVRLNDGLTEIVLIRRIVDVDYNTKLTENISTFQFSANDTEFTAPLVYNTTKTEVLAVGDSIQLIIQVFCRSKNKLNAYTFGVNVLGFPAQQEPVKAIYSESQSIAAASTANVILPHELFSRLCSIYTGSQMPFYSELFGRVDLGYPINGEWAYLGANNGLMIRDFPTDKAKFTSNLKDAFEAYNAVLNLAGGIEMTNNGPRFRIEKYGTTFDGTTILDIGEIYDGLTRKLNTEALFSEIIGGYAKTEPENLTGLDAFNGDFNWSLPLKSVTTKLDCRCKWVASDVVVEQTRRMQYLNTPKEDSKFDDNNFLICLKPITGTTELEAIKNDGYSSVTGILNPATAYNLPISPAQNLRRWGQVVRASLPKGGIIKYSAATKNSELVTVKDGVTIAENADIDVSTLDNPIYLPETLTINEFPMTRDQWDAIENNPRGLCAFRNKGVFLYGYIDDVDFNAAKGTSKITIIRANR